MVVYYKIYLLDPELTGTCGLDVHLWIKEKKRKVYAVSRPRALREEPLTKVRGLTKRPST